MQLNNYTKIAKNTTHVSGTSPIGNCIEYPPKYMYLDQSAEYSHVHVYEEFYRKMG